MNGPVQFKPNTIAAIIWGSFLLVCQLTASVAIEARSVVYELDIPSQNLDDALQALALASRHKLFYQADLVAGKVNPAVKGEYTVEQAIRTILSRTNLAYEITGDGVVFIRAAATPPSTKADPVRILEQDRPGLTSPTVRLAQNGPSPSTAESTNESPRKPNGISAEPGSGIEEIIVTARRREENIQSVPIAITVVSQEALQANNIQTLGDLQVLVPSMSSTSLLSRNGVDISIRGQGTNGISGLPGVVAYINEVPIPADTNGQLAGGPGLLFDLENIQVLKGPQGTLFGRNSVGGALLLQTARPTNDFGGNIQATYGNFNDREVNGAVNLPIVNDILLTRIAFSGQLRDGFTQLLGEPSHPNGIDADNRDDWSIRGTVVFHPSEVLQNDTILTYSKYYSHGSPWILTNVKILTNVSPPGLATQVFPTLPSLLTQQQALGVRTTLPVDNNLEDSGSNLSLNNITRVTVSDALTFRNIFGYDVADTLYQFDLDGTIFPIIENPGQPSDQKVPQFSEEAQLLGRAFGGHLDWQAGAFFLEQVVPRQWTPESASDFGSPLAGGAIRQGAKSKALYAQGTYDLSAVLTGLKLTAGVRYTWDENFFGNVNSSSATVLICEMPSPGCTDVTGLTARSRAPTWNVGLSYQVVPDTMLYLTSSTGYRPGGSNRGDKIQPEFNPEYVDETEFGVKSDWNVGSVRMRTNADVYYQSYTDIQVQGIVIQSNGMPVTTTTNAAAAKVMGAEFELKADLTSDVELGASYAYLNRRYTEFGAGVNSALLSATTTVGGSRNQYNVNARFRLPFPGKIGDVALRANWSWQSAFAGMLYSNAADVNGDLIEAHGLLNLNLDWNGIYAKPFDLSLFVSNATDKVYTTAGLGLYDSLGYVDRMFGEPRMYGARLRYRFSRAGKSAE